MIINSKLKIYPSIFVHIPKCGGSSIKEMLRDMNEKSDIHSKLKDDFYLLEKRNVNLKKYFVFTILRNPWDRVVSYYFFYRDIIKKDELVANKAKKLDFSSWINYIATNQQKFKFIHENYLDYLTFNNNVVLDYNMNFHNFDQECSFLKNLLVFKTNTLHLNKTNHEDYKSYYGEKEINLVKIMYQRDIDFFEFDFEDVAKMKKIKNEEKIKGIIRKKLFL